MTSSNESRVQSYTTILSRLIVVGFMILISYSLVRSIQVHSWIGFILALIALGAAGYFVYLLKKMKEATEQEESV